MVTLGPCNSLCVGSFCICWPLCLYLWLHSNPPPPETSWGLQPLQVNPSEGPWPSLASLCALWDLTSGVWPGEWDSHPRASTPGSPIFTCYHSLSLQGSDFPLKRRPQLFFFCILRNTEEAGAVQLHLGEILGTGLFGVLKPLRAFNTQKQFYIHLFIYLFSIFILTNTVIIVTKIKFLNY